MLNATTGSRASAIRRSAINWRMLPLLLLALIVLAAGGRHAEAHAVLERMAPEPGQRLTEGPDEISLGFNEPVDLSIGSVRVLDDLSRTVTDTPAEVSGDRRTVKLALPELGEGIYTVSYRVVSEDGHPVAGSYVFIVGNPPGAKDASAFDLHQQLGHTGHADGVATQLSVKEALIYAVRVFYFAALLLAAGWAFWAAWAPRRNAAFGAPMRDWTAAWGLWVMRGLLVSALLYVFFHSTELMEGQPAEDWSRLFLETDIGRGWAGLIILAAMGSLVRTASGWVGLLWAAAILGLESWSGHAAAYDPPWLTIGLDFVHLAGAALWAGGLALLVGLWVKNRDEAGRFAAVFSGPAFVSIAVLTVTGIAVTLQFLPRLDYLFLTGWGIILLIKTGLVVLVIATGAALRLRVRRGSLPRAMLLKADVALMAAIIVTVGLFTYISPLPANEPVYAHLMGEEMHLTFRVSPNVPGENDIIVKVWLPETVGEPKSVMLRLRSEDDADLGPIDVPIAPYADEEFDSFTGFVKATYRAEGPYIPFAGRWTAEIRIMDQQDNERVHLESFRNY